MSKDVAMEEILTGRSGEEPEDIAMVENATSRSGEGPLNDSSNCSQMEQSSRRRRSKVLIAICLNLALQVIFMKINQSNQATLVTVTNMVTLLHCLLDRQALRLGSTRHCRVYRTSPVLDRVLINAHSEREFKRRCRVNWNTFYYICSLVAPTMQKCKRGGGIPLERRVVVSLNRLGTGNYLLGCADLFGMSEGLACIVVRQFCEAIVKTLRPLVVPHFTTQTLPRLAKEFEAKHGIPFIIGAIDGSHIPIIAPQGDPAPFYNRKGFYSALLQGIVDMNCVFMDWDYGWCGSLHDYTVFVNSIEGRNLLACKYHPYKLIGDAAYPYRTCMYVPFKGTKETLEPAKAHWNFIQSSTRMYVECAFGILKGRWRMLLRRIEMSFSHTGDVVGACICLHNLCIMQNDFVDENLVVEAKRWLQEQHIEKFGDLRKTGTMHILDYGKAEVSRLGIDVEELLKQVPLEREEDVEVHFRLNSNVGALKAGVTMHREMARNLFERHLQEQAPLPDALHESDSSDSDDL